MYLMPETTKETIDNYVSKGWKPGSFVRAVLENNLKMSFGCADSMNTACLKDIVKYCYNEIPFECWGSPETVKNWLNKFRKSEDL